MFAPAFFPGELAWFCRYVCQLRKYLVFDILGTESLEHSSDRDHQIDGIRWDVHQTSS
jgi:hypothetical protein